MSIRQKWIDPALSLQEFKISNEQSLNIRSIDYIWNPSLIITNSLEMTKNGPDSIQLYPSGLVDYTQRFTLTTAENNDLSNLPFDERNCTISFSNDDSRAEWSRITSIIGPKSSWGLWILKDWHRDFKRLQLSLKRSVSIWLFTYFIPSMILVLCSWMSLCMSTHAQYSRMVLCLSALVTIIFIVLHHTNYIPRTSYLKAIDLWNFIIIFYAFLAVLHSAIVTSSASKNITTSRQKMNSLAEYEEKIRWLSQTPYYAQLPEEKPKTFAKMFDCIFLILFPSTFLVIAAVYFTYYLKAYIDVLKL